MENLHSKKTRNESNFDWLIRQMSINQKSGRQTFRRRFVSSFLFVSPCSPECHFQSETKIEPDLRLKLEDSGFLETLWHLSSWMKIVVGCPWSLYMFHRIVFLLLIVSTVSCNFYRCADCFQSFSEQRFPEYSKCRALNRFEIKKINIINSLLCWSVTVSMFIQTLATASTAKVRTGWPYRWFWKFL